MDPEHVDTGALVEQEVAGEEHVQTEL